MLSRILIAGLAAILSGCASNDKALDTAKEVSLIDPDIPPAVAGEDGWGYQQSAEADLDRDGVSERIVLTARAEMVRGRPAWDDGQPWQVYVEAADGTRRYVYAQRLQLGALTMRLALDEAGDPASIVLFEHLPDRLRLFEAFYGGPEELRTLLRFERMLDPRGELASPMLP